ncbi:MAG: 50S ribosomal protein L18, partial [Deltaproteobacteria bacterium]|nr:50S ribosomal protein L18 [Deltaproteobacteria bacterium]
RKRIKGSSERPRLNVYRSNRHIYAQIIDDACGKTLVQASTLLKEIEDRVSDVKKIEAARFVGCLVAKRAIEKGIEKVVFDRSGYMYHGRVKALAEAARGAGLKF